jgi:hypothetical protein
MIINYHKLLLLYDHKLFKLYKMNLFQNIIKKIFLKFWRNFDKIFQLESLFIDWYTRMQKFICIN